MENKQKTFVELYNSLTQKQRNNTKVSMFYNSDLKVMFADITLPIKAANNNIALPVFQNYQQPLNGVGQNGRTDATNNAFVRYTYQCDINDNVELQLSVDVSFIDMLANLSEVRFADENDIVFNNNVSNINIDGVTADLTKILSTQEIYLMCVYADCKEHAVVEYNEQTYNVQELSNIMFFNSGAQNMKQIKSHASDLFIYFMENPDKNLDDFIDDIDIEYLDVKATFSECNVETALVY